MSMTASQLYDKTTEIMDDEKISESLFLTLLSLAKNSRENERPWQFLKKEDSSQSASAGDTYLTMKTLVSDFAHALHLYVGTSFLEYEEIPFEIEDTGGTRGGSSMWIYGTANLPSLEPAKAARYFSTIPLSLPTPPNSETRCRPLGRIVFCLCFPLMSRLCIEAARITMM